MQRVLDVREDIRSGKEPFADIMRAAAELGADEELVVLAPFEPVPLYGVLGAKGFAHSATAIGDGDYQVIFQRQGA